MKHAVLQQFEATHMRKNALPDFCAGDTINVWVKIQEGHEKDGTPKYRLQSFEGVVLRYRRGASNATFLVRKLGAGGISVERNFFVHSPLIDHVDVKARGRVRRSRLYYMRKLKGKASRIASRFFVPQSSSAASKHQVSAPTNAESTDL